MDTEISLKPLWLVIYYQSWALTWEKNILCAHLRPSETNTSSDDDCVIIEPETESDFQKPDTSCNIPRPAKTNLMINTKKHLSSANHFPANSRIFNRSLQVIDWNWIFSKLSKNKRPDKNLDFVNRGGAECFLIVKKSD